MEKRICQDRERRNLTSCQARVNDRERSHLSL